MNRLWTPLGEALAVVLIAVVEAAGRVRDRRLCSFSNLTDGDTHADVEQ